ncbi:MAG: ferritin family protein [Syntrophobacteraceae bacterium]|nr:ferritin family protein [Syntrophobacteraceae bacterium]
MFTASELFELAVRVEENGERFYRDALKKTKPGLVKDLLVWLADQEVEHKNTFARIKEMVAGQTEQDPALMSLGRDVLVGAMGRHAFSLDELEIDSIRDEEEILRAALVFEEDTLIFFDFIAPFVSDRSISAMLDTIKAEERHHKQALLDKIAAIQRCPA